MEPNKEGYNCEKIGSLVSNSDLKLNMRMTCNGLMFRGLRWHAKMPLPLFRGCSRDLFIPHLARARILRSSDHPVCIQREKEEKWRKIGRAREMGNRVGGGGAMAGVENRGVARSPLPDVSRPSSVRPERLAGLRC